MKEKYLYILLLLFTITFSGYAQTAKLSNTQDIAKTDNILEKTQIYPNPVTSGKIYINTESSSTKIIEIYDMLGKKIFFTDMTSYQKELNISNLKSGVYLLKVTDKENSITRKIIIK